MEKEIKYEKLEKYPHMKPNDVEIWDRFIDKFPDFFDTVIYDFHVGEGLEELPTGSETPGGRENRLYQKKIDVLGYRGYHVTIVEIKPEADIKALGQVLTYYKLIDRGMIRDTFLQKMVIAERISNDMEQVYMAYGIMLFII